jgi:hypothetical protein
VAVSSLILSLPPFPLLLFLLCSLPFPSSPLFPTSSPFLPPLLLPPLFSPSPFSPSSFTIGNYSLIKKGIISSYDLDLQNVTITTNDTDTTNSTTLSYTYQIQLPNSAKVYVSFSLSPLSLLFFLGISYICEGVI